MKKYSILFISMLFCQTVAADIILKLGVIASDTGNNDTWAGIWGETDNCKYCIALFALETYKDDDNPRDKLVGVDYVIKAIENDVGIARVNLGFALSDGPLQDGEVFNFHFGLSMAFKNCIYKMSCSLNYDHFSNGQKVFNRDHVLVNDPLDLMSIGIGF